MSGISPARIDLRRLIDDARHHPAAEPARETERPLRPAPLPTKGARTRSPLTAALVAVGIVLGILATQLGLSIAVSQGAYEMRALEVEKRDLGRVQKVLEQNVDKLASPQNLADNAAQLGMVQNASPTALRLSDGAIMGALSAKVSDVEENLVPNSTLAAMPVVDAEGLLVSREAPVSADLKPVRWKGKLPAPDTH